MRFFTHQTNDAESSIDTQENGTLPVELSEILKHIKREEDCFKMRLVCRKWHSAVQKEFSRSIYGKMLRFQDYAKKELAAAKEDFSYHLSSTTINTLYLFFSQLIAILKRNFINDVSRNTFSLFFDKITMILLPIFVIMAFGEEKIWRTIKDGYKICHSDLSPPFGPLMKAYRTAPAETAPYFYYLACLPSADVNIK